MDELTIAFKIESPPSWLPIGRTAENNWRTVEIDCSYWFNMSADGEVALMYKPSCGMLPYPLLTEREGDNIIWRPKSGELVEGVGRLQAFFEVGTDVIGSSDMISCEVDSSLLGVEPGTDPGQTELPWALDIIEQIAELSGHYPKIIDGDLYIWDSTLNEWVEFEAGGSGGSETVIVTIDDTTGHMTASMNSNEIKAAVDAAKRVIVRYDGAEIPYLIQADTISVFSTTVNFGTLTSVAILVSANATVDVLSTDLVQSVNSQTGAVVLGASDVHALPETYVAPVQSVNGQTGAVTIPIPSLSGYATETWVEGKGYQTAQDVQTAIDAIPDELPAVTASDNGKFLRVVSGAWAAQTVPSAESNSFGGGS